MKEFERGYWKISTIENSRILPVTHPSSLVGNPLGDSLRQDEFHDESDDIGEKSADASLDDSDRYPIPKAEQSYHPPPRYVPVTKQPDQQQQQQQQELVEIK